MALSEVSLIPAVPVTPTANMWTPRPRMMLASTTALSSAVWLKLLPEPPPFHRLALPSVITTTRSGLPPGKPENCSWAATSPSCQLVYPPKLWLLTDAVRASRWVPLVSDMGPPSCVAVSAKLDQRHGRPGVGQLGEEGVGRRLDRVGVDGAGPVEHQGEVEAAGALRHVGVERLDRAHRMGGRGGQRRDTKGQEEGHGQSPERSPCHESCLREGAMEPVDFAHAPAEPRANLCCAPSL